MSDTPADGAHSIVKSRDHLFRTASSVRDRQTLARWVADASVRAAEVQRGGGDGYASQVSKYVRDLPEQWRAEALRDLLARDPAVSELAPTPTSAKHA